MKTKHRRKGGKRKGMFGRRKSRNPGGFFKRFGSKSGSGTGGYSTVNLLVNGVGLVVGALGIGWISNKVAGAVDETKHPILHKVTGYATGIVGAVAAGFLPIIGPGMLAGGLGGQLIKAGGQVVKTMGDYFTVTQAQQLNGLGDDYDYRAFGDMLTTRQLPSGGMGDILTLSTPMGDMLTTGEGISAV